MVRTRSHDEMVPAHETKKRLAACRNTQKIGETIFRCDLHHPLASHPDIDIIHHEEGLTKQKGHPDVRYRIEWHDTTPVVIR